VGGGAPGPRPRAARAAAAEPPGYEVPDRLGQAPEAGKLGPRDGEEAAVGSFGHHPVLAGDRRCAWAGGPPRAARALRRQRPDAGVGVDDVGLGDPRVGENPPGLLEQVAHVLPGGVHAVGALSVVGVGGADQREVPPGDDEHHALVVGGEVHRPLGEPREQEVDALGGAEDPLATLLDRGPRPDPVHPGAGGVDQEAALQGDYVAAHQVAHAHRPAPPRQRPDLLGLRVVEGGHAGPPGRQHVLQAEPLGRQEKVVEVVARAEEVLGPEGRLQGPDRPRVERPVALGALARGQPVVESESDPHCDEPPGPAPVHRHQEGERPDHLGGEPGQRLPLTQGLADELEVEPLEVPEAPVDELGRPRGGPRREVRLLDEDRREPAQAEVSRDARPRHTAPDDDGIDDGRVQPGEPVDHSRRPSKESST